MKQDSKYDWTQFDVIPAHKGTHTRHFNQQTASRLEDYSTNLTKNNLRVESGMRGRHIAVGSP